MKLNKSIFTKEEILVLSKLNTPSKIQDFLNKMPVNFEECGETLLSPRGVLKNNKCHCIEGAFFAAAALWFNGLGKPFVVDLRATPEEWDHVITVFKKKGKWGAISKTNHSVLRYREPLYRDIRELVMSYFHEYSDDYGKGEKTLREFSEPVDLSLFGSEWLISGENLWFLGDYLDSVKHSKILGKKQVKELRKLDAVEIHGGNVTEWDRSGKKKL